MFTAPWSYPEDLVSLVIDDGGNQGIPDNERIVDLTRGPPPYEGNKEYISRLKEDLGIKVYYPKVPKFLDARKLC